MRNYPFTFEQLRNDYGSGMTLSEVADKYGSSPRTVRRAMSAWGIAARPLRHTSKRFFRMRGPSEVCIAGDIAYVELINSDKRAVVDASDAGVVGCEKWYLGANGYATRNAPRNRSSASGGVLHMHRLLMGLVGAGRGLHLDHKNRDRLDNRRANLRVCTPQQNSCNTVRKRDKSPYRGVHPRGARRWSAQIQVNRKSISLGSFADPADAARAYDAMAREVYGEFAVLNFPEDAK